MATERSPRSRQARITRTAISPRLAMRTFRKGFINQPQRHRDTERTTSLRAFGKRSKPPGRRGAARPFRWSLCLCVSVFSFPGMGLQRDVAVLLGGVPVALGGGHLQAGGDLPPRGARLDHLVDEPAVGGHV